MYRSLKPELAGIHIVRKSAPIPELLPSIPITRDVSMRPGRIWNTIRGFESTGEAILFPFSVYFPSMTVKNSSPLRSSENSR